MLYNFNNNGFKDANSFDVSTSFGDNPLSMTVKGIDDKGKEWLQTLESIHFLW